MKKKVLLIVLMMVTLLACKKKEEPAPTPAPTPPTKIIAVKVNGSEKSCSTGSCWSSSNSAGRTVYFYLAGINESIYFGCFGLPSKGTHNLVKYGEPSLIYMKDNTYYRAVNGSVNITEIDTSTTGVIDKLVATFNFQTDTTGGQFFTLTEGAMRLKP